jgi:hypothetical protein
LGVISACALAPSLVAAASMDGCIRICDVSAPSVRKVIKAGCVAPSRAGMAEG